MYELKLNTWRLSKGLRLKTFLYAMLILLLTFCCVLCFLAGVMCFSNTSPGFFAGLISFTGLNPGGWADVAFGAILFPASGFFLICAFSLAFTLKARCCGAVAELCSAENREQRTENSDQLSVVSGQWSVAELCSAENREQRTENSGQAGDGYGVSFGNGVKFFVLTLMSLGRRLVIFLKFSLPFWVNLLIFCIFGVYFGFDRKALVFAALCLAFLLTFALVCTYYCSRQFDLGFYLMYRDKSLSPKNALEQSVRFSRGYLGKLTLYRLFLLPRKLACLFLPCLPFALTYCCVFNALVILPKNVEKPADVWYNKKTEKREKKGRRRSEKRCKAGR